MGSVGHSYDSALMENFFLTLKTELVYRNPGESAGRPRTSCSPTSTVGTHRTHPGPT